MAEPVKEQPSDGHVPPPITVAGGWGGMNLRPPPEEGTTTTSDNNNHHHKGEEFPDEVDLVNQPPSRTDDEVNNHPDIHSVEVVTHDEADDAIGTAAATRSRCSCGNLLERLENRAPRTYNVFFKILLPVFMIIPVSILCGYLLAKFESPNEKDSNNDAMELLLNQIRHLDEVTYGINEDLVKCFDTFNVTDGGDMINLTEYKAHMKSCDEKLQTRRNETHGAMFDYFVETMYGSITFEWITCQQDSSNSTLEEVQRKSFINEWLASFYELWEDYAKEESSSPDDAFDRAIADADGTESCTTNLAGASLFWWTIMTTVGYGNTAPQTDGGRILVYTMGFLTILIFTAIIAQAGYVMLAIFDDIFLRLNWKKLVHGLTASLFWFVIMLGWFCVIAGITVSSRDKKYDETMDFKDAFWFAFITGTTVGLGDIHLRHDMVKIGDLFYVPLVLLGAFVLLSNFLFKISNVLTPYLEEGDDLHTILKRSRDNNRNVINEGVGDARTTCKTKGEETMSQTDYVAVEGQGLGIEQPLD